MARCCVSGNRQFGYPSGSSERNSPRRAWSSVGSCGFRASIVWTTMLATRRRMNSLLSAGKQNQGAHGRLQLRSGSSIRCSRRRLCSSWLTFKWGAERMNDRARGVDAAEDRVVLARCVHRVKGPAGRCVAAPPRGAAGGLAGAWSGRFGLFGVCACQAPSRAGHRAGVRWWSHRGQRCCRMAPASPGGWIVQDAVVVG
jgi:hypothetical protein